MKTCAQFEESLIAAASGEAAADVRIALDAHLKECMGCRTRFADERRLFAMVDAGLMRTVAGEPSQAFAANVMAHVTGEAERALLARIDAGVAATMAAEPSSQFAAAVRSRIATEPAPRQAWFSVGWWVPAAGAVAATVLLVVMLQKPPTPVRDATTGIINSVPPLAEVSRAEGTARTPSERRHAPRKPRIPLEAVPLQVIAASALEVLILPEERHVAGFYRFVQEGRLNAAQVLFANRIELTVLLGEMQTPSLVLRGAEVKTLDLVDSVRSTSGVTDKQ